MAVIFSAVAAIGWTDDEFIVTYDYGFDGRYETTVVKKGYVKDPLLPGRYGHIFDGWYYTDKQGNEILFDFESERVTTDLELTAHWVPFDTEMTLYPNGGKCDIDSMILLFGEEYELPVPKRSGYYFVGWSGEDKFPRVMNGIWGTPVPHTYLRAYWSKFRPGTVYRLGEYEQSAIYDKEELVGWEKEPIEWVPVDKKDGKYLLVTRHVIDYRRLSTEPGRSVHWSQSELRRWLNDEFYNQVFTDKEKEMICDFTDSELGTTDKVFLLSIEEADMLYGDDLYVLGTDYANHKGFDDEDMGSLVGNTWFHYWMTRTCDNDFNYLISGTAQWGGGRYELAGIRPAIWVDASKLSGR